MVKTSLSNAVGIGSNLGQAAKTLHASGPKTTNYKTEFLVTFLLHFVIFLLQYCNEFNKHFKNGPHQTILKKKKRMKYPDMALGQWLLCCPDLWFVSQ